MIQAVLTIAIVAIAVLVGQAAPALGALIATFPVKIVAYAFANPGGDLSINVTALVIGSVASALAAITMLVTLRMGFTISTLCAVVMWFVVATIGRLLTQ